MRRAPRPLLLLVALGALSLGGTPGTACADAPAAPVAGEHGTAIEEAFRLLASPLQEERRQGVSGLVALLPEARERVIKTLPSAAWNLQLQLIEVLSRDGSPAAERALLDHLMRTEETQAVRIRLNLARDPEACARLLAAFRADPRGFLSLGGAKGNAAKGNDAQGLRRLMDLLSVLQRAEIEEKFLSRKSASGSTGYYRGQYDLLKDPALGETYRQLSLDVVTGIALDEAVPTPGLYRAGAYRFLRSRSIDEIELVGMAVNAIAELCTPDDVGIISRLRRHLVHLDRKRDMLYMRLRDVYTADRWGKSFEEAHQDWEDALGDYGEILACLAIIEPEQYNRYVTSFIMELETYGGIYQPLGRMGLIAGLLIRVGRYWEAIQAYEAYLLDGNGSEVLSHYNLACAWASYAEVDGASTLERAQRKQRAIQELAQSVAAGWSDVGWMNQDRDLDAIRDTDVYRALVKQIEDSFRIPDEEDK